MQLLAALFALTLISCTPTFTLTPLAANYRVAAEKHEPRDFRWLPEEEMPRLRLRTSFRDRIKLALVPYARLDARHESGASLLRAIWREGAKHRADVVEVFAESSKSSGPVFSTHLAMGISMGSQAEEAKASAILYRWAKCQLGFVIDEVRMVTEVTPEARKAGVIEGDRLVAVDGVEVDTDPLRSTYLRVLLEKKAGDLVRIDLIRPGKGKMALDVKLLPAERAELEGENPIPWSLPRSDDHSRKPTP